MMHRATPAVAQDSLSACQCLNAVNYDEATWSELGEAHVIPASFGIRLLLVRYTRDNLFIEYT